MQPELTELRELRLVRFVRGDVSELFEAENIDDPAVAAWCIAALPKLEKISLRFRYTARDSTIMPPQNNMCDTAIVSHACQ
jgi:hypothetical protein